MKKSYKIQIYFYSIHIISIFWLLVFPKPIKNYAPIIFGIPTFPVFMFNFRDKLEDFSRALKNTLPDLFQKHVVCYGIITKITVIFISLISFCTYAQETSNLCSRTKKIKAEQRLKQYPFNIAATIKFASFNNMISDDGQTFHNAGKIPLTEGKVDLKKMKEINNVTSSEINLLTDILYNYGQKNKIKIFESAGCYEPRNAVLFINEKGEVIEYIELCFQCGGINYGYKKFALGEECREKIEMIKNLFSSNGIKFGVTEK